MYERAVYEKWLRGPRLKIIRAKKHIDEFEDLTKDFLARNPYRITVEENMGQHRVDWPYSLIFYAREEIPEYLSTVIGDAVHNLRSSLDLLLCALARANGRSDRGVQFTIARDADGLDQAIKDGNVARGGPIAIDFFRSLNPHRGEGGNWAISTIHDLDRLDKHRLIIAIAAAGDLERVIVGLRWERSMCITIPGYRWTGLEDGTKLIDIRPDAGFKVGDDVHAAFSITFGNGQPASTCPVIDTLRQIADYIETIISGFAVRDEIAEN